MAVGDKFILTLFASVQDIGVYSMACQLRADAEAVPQRVRVGVGAVLLRDHARAGCAARVPRGHDLRRRGAGAADGGTVGGRARRGAGDDARLLPRARRSALEARRIVITWTAVGVLLQGVYLLTSIGLNITKRTQYYPVATMAAAATNVGLNFLLIPRFGIVGAALGERAPRTRSRRCSATPSRSGSIRSRTSGDGCARVACSRRLAYVAARSLPSIRLAASIRGRGWRRCPTSSLRGTTVVVVYVGLLAVTRILSRRGAARAARRFGAASASAARRSRRRRTRTEMAGEIVSTDLRERR